MKNSFESLKKGRRRFHKNRKEETWKKCNVEILKDCGSFKNMNSF